MAKTLQFRIGTTSELSSQAGAAGNRFIVAQPYADSDNSGKVWFYSITT